MDNVVRVVGVGVVFLHALYDPVCGIGRADGVATPAHEICTCCVLRIVDRIAYLAGDVTKVARVAWFVEVGFAASL